MKIVKLTAENVKRLKAVTITPEGGGVVTITGRNAQGKTSVLDAIWLALGGGVAGRATKRPIRDGEDRASVTLDLGDLIVSRQWKGDKTTLTVTAADGARYSSPQGMLDKLVGQLSFDPLEFTRLSSRDQSSALLDIVDLDVDLNALSAERQGVYDERTQVGRDKNALGQEQPVDSSLPTSEHSSSELFDKLLAAEDLNRDIKAASRTVTAMQEEISQLERKLRSSREVLASAQEMASRIPVDTDAMHRCIDSIESANAAIRANNAARDINQRRHELQDRYDELTATIRDFDEREAAALAAATFPVDGLGFSDGGVTLHGVPFSQASSAEQIRVSLAMAMALNPELRVIRILDGSLLDRDNLALIAEAAAEHDYQVWIERVSDDSPTAVVIEDGEVVEGGE